MGHRVVNGTSCAGVVLALHVLLLMMVVVEKVESRGVRDGGACPGSRREGDKWFDGCQWCVCTDRGQHCSSSHCSSLVKKVPACQARGQRWTDGCYRCRCRRHGIVCRLEATCRLLRHNPVPCLADKRCVCGPDGVPACTAEVMDRNAFDAHRIDVGIPEFLHSSGGRKNHVTGEKNGRSLHGNRQNSHERFAEQDHHQEMFPQNNRLNADALSSVMINDQGISLRSSSQSSQELLIRASDNLCRFGPRWYGGSLRCFCDVDGSITCGNPTVVSAFFDDFKVTGEACEQGHAWEDKCKVCTCRVNGVVFCHLSHTCEHGLLTHDDDEDGSRIDHYLPGFSDILEVTPPTPSPSPKLKTVPSDKMCRPGSRWNRGCVQCRCNHHGKIVCNRHHCADDKESANNDVNGFKPHTPTNNGKDISQTVRPNPNRTPRGPMMVVPKPVEIFSPPAYTGWSPRPSNTKKCGRFKVGQKYWDDCNLCLCTRRGPRCQGKLCR